jgi:VCBS repeat protein/FG-GAP repeat protein
MGARAGVVVILAACVAPTLAGGSTQASTRFPTFARPTVYKTFQSPSAVAVGDLNGDGKADLAEASIGGGGQGTPGAVSVLLNKGAGRFQPARNYRTDKSYDIVASDLNGDRRPDLAVIGGESFSAVVFINKGDGTLAAEQFYGVGNFATDNVGQAIAAGDLNGDGKTDLATADPSYSVGAGSMSVLINRGDGTFNPRVAYPTDGGSESLSIAIGDLNGDRRPDVAIAHDTSEGKKQGLVSVFITRGDGTLPRPRLYPAGDRPVHVEIGDLNRDGKADLVTANLRGNSVSVLLNRGDGSFRAKRDFRTSTACLNRICVPDEVAIGDLNGDGAPDLAVSDRHITVLLNRGNGSFSSKRDYSIRGNIGQIAIADLNGDRRQDLAVVQGGALTVLLNTTRR